MAGTVSYCVRCRFITFFMKALNIYISPYSHTSQTQHMFWFIRSLHQSFSVTTIQWNVWLQLAQSSLPLHSTSYEVTRQHNTAYGLTCIAQHTHDTDLCPNSIQTFESNSYLFIYLSRTHQGRMTLKLKPSTWFFPQDDQNYIPSSILTLSSKLHNVRNVGQSV